MKTKKLSQRIDALEQQIMNLRHRIEQRETVTANTTGEVMRNVADKLNKHGERLDDLEGNGGVQSIQINSLAERIAMLESMESKDKRMEQVDTLLGSTDPKVVRANEDGTTEEVPVGLSPFTKPEEGAPPLYWAMYESKKYIDPNDPIRMAQWHWLRAIRWCRQYISNELNMHADFKAFPDRQRIVSEMALRMEMEGHR